jgi:hypothetical protein
MNRRHFFQAAAAAVASAYCDPAPVKLLTKAQLLSALKLEMAMAQAAFARQMGMHLYRPQLAFKPCSLLPEGVRVE